MALARLPTMGFAPPSPSTLGPILAVLNANGPYWEAYKAEYGLPPVGQTVTLANGVQGHLTEAGLFQIDYTPPQFSQQAQANYAASQAGATPPYPAPVVYQPPPPPVFPGAPGRAPAAAATSSSGAAAPKPFFGIPPLALVAGGGLLVFLIARRF